MLKRLRIYRTILKDIPKPQSKEQKEFAERYANMTLEEMDKYHDEFFKEYFENNPLPF